MALTTNLPGGVTLTGGSQEQHDFLRMRGEFAAAYCEHRGWKIESLTIQQVMEIRSQPGWKNPQGFTA